MFLNTKGILLKQDLTCNFREKIYLKDFIYKLDGKLQNNHQIDTNKVGYQNLKAIYKDKFGFYKVKTFKIEIKDVTPPTILINESYTVKNTYEGRLEDDIICVDDTDDNIKCEINGSYNLADSGIYPLTITAKDKSGNKEEKTFKLNVIEDIKKNNITPNQEESFISYSDTYQKYKQENTLIGIDVSKWQEEIDFHKLKENNVEFVMIKLGGQKDINSKLELDSKFNQNIERALKENIKVGIYFYSYAKNIKQAKEQANFIIKNLKNYQLELPIAFDWENWKEYNKFNLSLNSLNNIAKTFMETLKSKGYKTLLYSSNYYLDNIWFKEDYKNIWIANYGNLEDSYKYNMWQLCSDGKVEGINSYVDIDIMYLDNIKG